MLTGQSSEPWVGMQSADTGPGDDSGSHVDSGPRLTKEGPPTRLSAGSLPIKRMGHTRRDQDLGHPAFRAQLTGRLGGRVLPWEPQHQRGGVSEQLWELGLHTA